MSTETPEYKYWAFVSYSSKDRAWAKWLHASLESYRLPVQLVRHQTPIGDPAPKHLKPLFWDRAELQAHHNLGELIERSLRESRYLIVICSPNSAQSPWVEKEIQSFQEVHGIERVLSLIIDGEPNAKDDTNCFPPTLRAHEPKAPDARPEGDGKTNAKLMLLATMLGISFDALKRRDQERRMKVMRLWLGGAVSILAMMVWLAWQMSMAKERAVVAEEKTSVQLKETQRQLERSQLEEGRAWLERAKLAKGKGNHLTALMLAGRAVGFRGLGRSIDEPEELEKEFRLLLGSLFESDPEVLRLQREEVRALADFVDSVRPTYLPIWSSPVRNHHRDFIECVAFSPDGKRIASGSADTTVKLWDATTGEELAILWLGEPIHSVAFSPDGSQVAGGSTLGTAKLWDVATEKELDAFSGHGKFVASVAFSADGSLVVSGALGDTVKLWNLSMGEELIVLQDLKESVYSLAFSPDGSRLVVGAMNDTATVWDLATGEEVVTLTGHKNVIERMVFSPDGERIVTGSWDGTAKLWNAETGEELHTLKGHEGGVYSVAFNPDGTLVASGSEDDNTVRIWDVASGKELASLFGHSSRVAGVAFSPNADKVVSGSYDDSLKYWEVASMRDLSASEGHGAQVSSVAFSPDGTRVISGSQDKTVKIWDATTGEELAALIGHSDRVTSVAFSPDGSTIASGSDDLTVRVWDAKNGEEVARWEGHLDPVLSVAFNPKGDQIASGSAGGMVKTWDAASGSEIDTFSGFEEVASCVSFSPDGKRIASAGDTSVRLWDVATGKSLHDLEGFEAYVLTVAFSPDGTRVASGLEGRGIVELWDTTTGERLAVFSGHEESVPGIAFSPDGMRLATGSSDKTVRLWDLAKNVELAVLEHADYVTSVAFSPDGTRLVSGSSDGTLKIWDVDAGKELAVLEREAPSTKVAFSPDGALLASGSMSSYAINIWDTVTRKCLATLRGHEDGVESLAFSRDGSQLATSSWDGTVKLWDAATGEELLSIEMPEGGAYGMVFNLDGSQLMVGLNGGIFGAWDTETGEELGVAPVHSGAVFAVALSSDGTLLATGSRDKTVKLWKSQVDEEPATLEHESDVMSVAFSPDASRLASGTVDGIARVWNSETREELYTLDHGDSVTSLVFSHDGTRLFGASRDGSVKIWNIQTGTLLASFLGHDGGVSSLALSPNGELLASGGWNEAPSVDGTLKLWDATIGKEHGTRILDIPLRDGHEADYTSNKSPFPDLMQLQRQKLLRLEGKEVAFQTNPSLLSSLSYTPAHTRHDETVALADSAMEAEERSRLRLILLGRAFQWRGARELWRDLQGPDPDASKNQNLRQRYFIVLLSSALDLVEDEFPEGLADLLSQLAESVTREDLADPLISLPLASLLGERAILIDSAVEDSFDLLLQKVAKLSSVFFLEAVGDRIVQRGEDSPAVAQSLRTLHETFPDSEYLLDLYIDALSTEDPEWLPSTEKLLSMPGATEFDWIDAAYDAATNPALVDTANEFLRRADTKFPDVEYVSRMAGWIHINLGDTESALRSFEDFEASLSSEETPDMYFLAGMAIALWINERQDEAIATYRKLVEAASGFDDAADLTNPKTIRESDFSEAERIPLEQIRAATLAKHPDLKPDAEPQ